MKGSLLTSVALHVLLLAFAMTSLSAPEAFDVADVEALPVDLVPISELTQIQQGDKSAPVAEKAAPVPTKNPKHVENAENMGDNDVDLKTPPTPQTRPKEQEVAAAPTPTEKPAPIQDSKPTESKDIVKEDTAPPVPNVKPEPKPQPPEPKPEPKPPEPKPEPKPPEPKPPEPKPEPKPEAKPQEPPQSETGEIPVPQNLPKPEARPKPPETKVADAKPTDAKPTDAKATEQASAKDAKPDAKKQEAAKSASSKQSDFNADEVAALLNKTDAKGGGAKRSADKAAFGGKKTTGGSTLSQSEMDALRGQIQKNWSVISGIEGAEGIIIRVTMKLDQNGEIVGQPEVEASGGSESARRTLQGSALRAVRKSAPFKGLPPDKYDAWSEVVVNFDPSELL